MKTKTRRYRVGNYLAEIQGKEIVVGYISNGEFHQEARFNQADITKIEQLMSLDVETARQAKQEKEDRISALIASLRTELDISKSNPVDVAYVGEEHHRATVNSENVYVGCTGITRKKFAQLAKLIS